MKRSLKNIAFKSVGNRSVIVQISIPFAVFIIGKMGKCVFVKNIKIIFVLFFSGKAKGI